MHNTCYALHLFFLVLRSVSPIISHFESFFMHALHLPEKVLIKVMYISNVQMALKFYINVG